MGGMDGKWGKWGLPLTQEERMIWIGIVYGQLAYSATGEMSGYKWADVYLHIVLGWKKKGILLNAKLGKVCTGLPKERYDEFTLVEDGGIIRFKTVEEMDDTGKQVM